MKNSRGYKMPYIPKEQRGLLTIPCNAGGLNYKITTILLAYLAEKGECYQTFNDMMGALEGAKMELYRRKIAPYEDRKCAENGDVY